MTALVSNILKIRPILQVNPDGTLGVREKISGPRNKAIQALIDGFKRDAANMDYAGSSSHTRAASRMPTG